VSEQPIGLRVVAPDDPDRGLDTPTVGEYWPQRPESLPASGRRRALAPASAIRRSGFVFQTSTCCPRPRPWPQRGAASHLCGHGARARRAQAAHALERVGLGLTGWEHPDTRVSVGRGSASACITPGGLARASRPSILLADGAPPGNLDSTTSGEIMQVFAWRCTGRGRHHRDGDSSHGGHRRATRARGDAARRIDRHGPAPGRLNAGLRSIPARTPNHPALRS